MQWRDWGWRLAAVGVMLLSAGVVAAPKPDFLGRVAVEWDDTDLFNRHRVVLLADFGFQDAAGKQWIVRKGAALDGSSFTPLFEQLVGLPFVGEHRRAGIMHDYFAQQLSHDWQQVRRMYYEALIAEGLGVTEAKTAYAVLYGVGMRWEKKGSSCYVNCHSGATALRWRPDVTEAEFEPVFELLNEGNPTLDDIDQAVDAVVPRPGPHLFSQLRPGDNGALRPQRLPSRSQVPDSDPAEASATDEAPADDSAQERDELPGEDSAGAEAPEAAGDAEQADAAGQDDAEAAADQAAHEAADAAAEEGAQAAGDEGAETVGKEPAHGAVEKGERAAAPARAEPAEGPDAASGAKDEGLINDGGEVPPDPAAAPRTPPVAPAPLSQ